MEQRANANDKNNIVSLIYFTDFLQKWYLNIVGTSKKPYRLRAEGNQ